MLPEVIDGGRQGDQMTEMLARWRILGYLIFRKDSQAGREWTGAVIDAGRPTDDRTNRRHR